MFIVNHRNTRASCEICSKLTIKTPEPCQWRRFGVFIVKFEHTIKTLEQRQWRRFGVFNVKFEHVSHLVLVFLLLTLSR